MEKALRVLLVLQFLGIIIYTGYAVGNEGWNLFPIFLDNLQTLNWSGQFNFDFMNYLVLSGIWVAWRENFSAQGIVLGAIASVLGILFFAPYLLIASLKAKGNAKALFLGQQRAA